MTYNYYLNPIHVWSTLLKMFFYKLETFINLKFTHLNYILKVLPIETVPK